MAARPKVPMLVSEGNLSRYLQDIRKFPMLEPDQEYMLAKRWREDDEIDAAHQLVTSHLRLVAKIAMGYRGYGLPPRHLRHVVDPRRHPGIHPALVVAG